MTMRTLLGLLALTGVCLLGCGDKKKDDAKDKSTKKDAAAKKDVNEAAKKPNKSEPVETVQYEPYDAKKWAPDPGQADPNAWNPQDSKAGKVSGAVFNALFRAVTSSDEPYDAEKRQPEPEKQP